MKRLILLALVVLPFMAIAQIHFSEGTQWKTLYIGTHTPEGVRTLETITLESCMDGDTPALGLFRINTPDQDNQLLHYIRTEGDKVWFKPGTKDAQEWLLMYDFGLKPGEGCYVYRPEEGNINPLSTYIECIKLDTKYLDQDYETLTLNEYQDDTKNIFYGCGIWLKGLSSVNGFLCNNCFNFDGGASYLLEMTNGEDTYYKRFMAESGVEAISEPTISIVGEQVIISGYAHDELGALYTTDGRLISNFTMSKDNTIAVKLPTEEICILKIGNKTWKIVRLN